MIEKTCSKCNESKEQDSFQKGRATCKDCQKIYHAEYRIKNKDKIKKGMKVYWSNNKDKIKKYQKEYRTKNIEKIVSINKKWRELDSSKEYIKQYRKSWQSERLNKDESFKLRRNISRLISFKIKKNYESSFKYLPYTVQELKINIESKFEPWMTWNNWGKYSVKTWDDNDLSTWTWQIDHIIPQSDLIYDSMEHINFQKCWSLDNLRPYSSKQNQKDGVTRIRHVGL